MLYWTILAVIVVFASETHCGEFTIDDCMITLDPPQTARLNGQVYKWATISLFCSCNYFTGIGKCRSIPAAVRQAHVNAYVKELQRPRPQIIRKSTGSLTMTPVRQQPVASA